MGGCVVLLVAMAGNPSGYAGSQRLSPLLNRGRTHPLHMRGRAELQAYLLHLQEPDT